ncbi:MAG: GDSL-type esterase/lipase family protein [Oscillospiraceae bacterium]
MAKYVASDAKSKRKKQQNSRKILMYSCMAIFVLVASLGIVKVVEFFGSQGEKTMSSYKGTQKPNTDVVFNGKWSEVTGPVEKTINLSMLTPEPGMMQVAENGKVDLSYFDNAVFIGDSLADGFRVYKETTGLTNSTFLTAKSTNPRSFTQGGYITINGEAIHAFTAIEQLNPGKVYVTLGTNALMAMEPAEFMETYYEFIHMLKQKAPNALIYVTSIPPTTAEKSAKEPRLDIFRIFETNRLIAKMCNEEGISYVNLYEVLKSGSGYLREEIAAKDGIHLTPSGYAEWANYLIGHTVYNQISPNPA